VPRALAPHPQHLFTVKTISIRSGGKVILVVVSHLEEEMGWMKFAIEFLLAII
jgi:hypothetical protein